MATAQAGRAAVPGAEARIDHVRRFNRFYTRIIGVLQDGYLHSPFSLAQVRVLSNWRTGRARPLPSSLASWTWTRAISAAFWAVLTAAACSRAPGRHATVGRVCSVSRALVRTP